MVYQSRIEIYSIPAGTKLWACAYEFDNNKTSMSLVSRPIYGMARGFGWAREGNTQENPRASVFVPFRAGSETAFAKSKAVNIMSRVYADTYEECVELFNHLVQEKVEWFLERAEETKKDLIGK